MAAPKTTIWSLEPHTQAKHEILKRYLEAWMPILTLGGFPEILYIDGFAGPGQYIGGADGSPIIALNAALAHQDKIRSKVHFAFVEIDPDRAAFLEELIAAKEIPPNFLSRIYQKDFREAYKEIKDEFIKRTKKLPPSFAFIDPFGWKNPLEIVKDVLSFQSCEVFINFMYEEINRFLSHPDQLSNFNELFGTSKWQEAIQIINPSDRRKFIHDLYMQQLKESAGATYVRSFVMKNKSNATDYILFYATKNLRGLQKMKEAMWKVDKGGSFTFSDLSNPDQLVLLGDAPEYLLLKKQLLKKFSGRSIKRSEIEIFVLTETAFRETHYKSVLKELEGLKLIEVINPQPKRRAGTFPDENMVIKFSQS